MQKINIYDFMYQVVGLRNYVQNDSDPVGRGACDACNYVIMIVQDNPFIVSDCHTIISDQVIYGRILERRRSKKKVLDLIKKYSGELFFQDQREYLTAYLETMDYIIFYYNSLIE